MARSRLIVAQKPPAGKAVLKMTTNEPDNAIARSLAAAAVGRSPAVVRRFSTGLHHYVFEVTFEDREPVVVRIAAEHSRSVMVQAHKLSQLLRPLGVPLPEIIAEGADHQYSHLILERLPGTDLGEVIHQLSDASQKRSQRGWQSHKRRRALQCWYGVTDAPLERWSHVLQDNLTRSRKRIATAKLFNQDAVDTVAHMVSAAQAELDAFPPVAFLHDTTTKNVIVTPEGTFSGIVDVDDLCFGDPHYVVALTMTSLMVTGGPTHYIDAWMNAADYQNDWIFRLYVALFLVDFMSAHGKEFNGNVPPSSEHPRNKEYLRRID
jgi:aminoglycoside phosphotransferase